MLICTHSRIEICDETNAGQTIMCPQCDKFCSYWELKDSCFLVKLTYVFDNFATIFFSIFMCIWGESQCSSDFSTTYCCTG